MESAYQRGADNLRAALPGQRFSGAYGQGMTDLATNRAIAESSMFGDLVGDEYARRERRRAEDIMRYEGRRGEELARRQGMLNLATQMATGGTAQGLGAIGGSGVGLGTAAGAGAQQAAIAGMAANREAQKKGGQGELIGTLGGSYLLGGK